MAIDTVLWSRLVTGLTLGFHVIFATIGVGIPLMIAIAEFIGIRKKDPHYTLMAKRWSRGFVISVAVGVVTGTAISLQLTPGITEFYETGWECHCTSVIHGGVRVLFRGYLPGHLFVYVGSVQKSIYPLAADDTDCRRGRHVCRFYYDGERIHEPA